MASAFTSRLCDLAPHASGWTRLPSGVEITALPIWDENEELFARLGPQTSADWCKANGYRLATVDELLELWKKALHIEPFTMPTLEQLEAAGIDHRNEEAVNAFRNANMRSLEWCRIHDAAVFLRLDETGWDGDQCAFNAGKHWAAGDIIFGWFSKLYGWIQGARRGAHIGTYTDYATTFHAVRDLEDKPEADSSPDTVPQPTQRTLKLSRPLMQGDDVHTVQRAIGSKPDGWYGPNTARAVRRFQAAHDLAVDGTVGPMTWAAIAGAPAVAIVPPPPARRVPEGYPIIRAKRYRWGKRASVGDVHMPTVHTIQCPPRARFARQNAEWFAGHKAPNASIHWWVGPDEIIQGLEEKHIAFGAKSGPERHAQNFGIHVEHTGYTGNPSRGLEATDWLGEGLPVLELGAKLMAEIVKRWDLLAERVDPERLTAWRDAMRAGDRELAWSLRGITDHAAWTRAYGVPGGHLDVGPTWPWPEYLELVRAHI